MEISEKSTEVNNQGLKTRVLLFIGGAVTVVVVIILACSLYFGLKKSDEPIATEHQQDNDIFITEGILDCPTTDDGSENIISSTDTDDGLLESYISTDDNGTVIDVIAADDSRFSPGEVTVKIGSNLCCKVIMYYSLPDVYDAMVYFRTINTTTQVSSSSDDQVTSVSIEVTPANCTVIDWRVKGCFKTKTSEAVVTRKKRGLGKKLKKKLKKTLKKTVKGLKKVAIKTLEYFKYIGLEYNLDLDDGNSYISYQSKNPSKKVNTMIRKQRLEGNVTDSGPEYKLYDGGSLKVEELMTLSSDSYTQLTDTCSEITANLTYFLKQNNGCCEPVGADCVNFIKYCGLHIPKCFLVKFLFYNRQTGSSYSAGVQMNPENIPSSFVFSEKTVFVVHGFNDKPNKGNKWMIKIMANLLQTGDFNIILVDWHQYSNGNLLHPYNSYVKAASNTRMTAKRISDLALHLIAKGLSRKNIHCIGHSLGAHACGFAGKYMGPFKFGRISGLDPAGPEFKARNSSQRLYKTDADYVDVIHTDAGGLFPFGFLRNVGHADFYPNGGTVQTGCVSRKRRSLWDRPLQRSKRGAIQGVVGCSHARATDLYVASILSDKCYATKTCSSYDKVSKADCKGSCDRCQRMGYHSVLHNKTHGLFYLSTTDAKPFCKG